MESSEPKSAPDSAVGSEDGALIFMSDASAEADRLSAALRARGYAVVDVPLGLLAGRAAVQRPAAVICDADAPGTLETLRRMQGATGGRAIDVLLLAGASSTGEPARLELERDASASFVRPVSAEELVRKLELLIGPPKYGSSPSASGGRPAVLVATARRPYRYEGHRLAARSPLSAAPPPPGPPSVHAPASVQPGSSLGASSAPPGMRASSFPPPVTSRGSLSPHGVSAMPHARLSPELEQLLGRAEQRVRQAPLGVTTMERLSPEAEVEAVLPAELLAALDDPLEIDDEDEEDSAAGTAGGSGGGSEAGRGTRGTTSDGGAGTAAGGRAARREATTGAGSDISGKFSEFASPEGEFPNEAPTVAPLRPSQLPPASLRTTLDRPLAATDSRAPAASEFREPPPSMSNPSPEIPRTTKPPHQEPQRETVRPTPLPGAFAPPAPAPLPAHPRAEVQVPAIPAVLGDGDGFRALARAVAARFVGAIALEDAAGIRRIVFRDGDFVTAASSAESESLTAFLTERGDLSAEIAQRVGRRVPPFGRHAGAALIAQGHLRQDELWTVLRSHAEWLIGRVAGMREGAASLELEVPPRLQAEPGVFGGATGAEVLVEIARRVKTPGEALARLGGRAVVLAFGATDGLLGECALPDAEAAHVRNAGGTSVGEVLTQVGNDDFACVLWALVELGVLVVEGVPKRLKPGDAFEADRPDPLDAAALRERISARRGLVEEGDYFALLGVARSATSYDVRRAYLAVRKSFDPARILTPETVDLKDDLEAILEVLDEAYEILGDPLRRERYRRALDAIPG